VLGLYTPLLLMAATKSVLETCCRLLRQGAGVSLRAPPAEGAASRAEDGLLSFSLLASALYVVVMSLSPHKVRVGVGGEGVY
jgi:hypothetical protein